MSSKHPSIVAALVTLCCVCFADGLQRAALKGDVSAVQPVLLEANDPGNLRGGRTVSKPNESSLNEIPALKARIAELEQTRGTGVAQEGFAADDPSVATSGSPVAAEVAEGMPVPDALVADVSASDESTPPVAKVVEALEIAGPPVGTSELPEASEDLGEAEAVRASDVNEDVEAADAPVGTSANTEVFDDVEDIEAIQQPDSDEAFEPADASVGTSDNPEVFDAEAIREPEVEEVVETVDAPVSDGVEKVEAIEGPETEEEVSIPDSRVGTSENPQVPGDAEDVEAIEESEVEKGVSIADAPVGTMENSDVVDNGGEVEAIEDSEPNSEETPSDEITQDQEASAGEDLATAEAPTLASMPVSDLTAAGSPIGDEGKSDDTEISDISVVGPETAVFAGTAAESETQSGEMASAQAQLSADRTEVLRMRTALRKEKDDIALVKAQLIEQITAAATKEEELEAKNQAWIAEKQNDLKREAEHATVAEVSKVDELEHEKESLEVANQQLQKKTQQLQEQRDSVVGELRRSVEQNEKMRELMEDIRDDQLRAASQDTADHAEATDTTTSGALDHVDTAVVVSSEPSDGDKTSIIGTGKVAIGSSDHLPLGDEKDRATLTSTLAEERVSPILAVKHISKTGSSTILSLLGRMTERLPSLYPGHGEFVHYIDELSPVARKSDGGSEEFVISSVRNPCDWYVTLWAFSSQYDAKALRDYGSASDPEPFFGDTSNATKFANWLSWAQGQWDEPRTGSECNAVMSLRYWEALKSGHHVGGINERGYNGATLDKYTRWFDGAPRQRIADDLRSLNPSKDVDCWVSKENLMGDLQDCLKEYEHRSGVHLDWEPFTEKLAAEKRAADAHLTDNRLQCEHYYSPELAESVVRHDRHLFEAFGYDSCCGARRKAA